MPVFPLSASRVKGLFSDDYESARGAFLAAVPVGMPTNARLGFRHPGQGPGGARLVTDTLWLGDPRARSVLVLISATHGVEGFAGSAIQCDFLQYRQQLPDNVAVLLVHALNPWGFAWLRRCDRNGVDLNRNFVDFTGPLPANPGYHELRNWLFCEDTGLRDQALRCWGEKHGREALEIAISGGQYEDPDGPFYGGLAPSFSRRVIERLMTMHGLGGRRLAVVDLHTGLGEWARGEVICDHAPDSDGAVVARRWYGNAVTLPAAGTSSSVPKLGLMDYAWHRIMDTESCFVTLEFGTYSTERLFSVLMDDHRLTAARTDTGNAEQLRRRESLREHFCPRDPQWRRDVLGRGREVIGQALEGLTRES